MNENASEIIKKCLLNSPSHGIRRIGRAKTITTRIFWAFTFWLSTSLMSTFIYSIIIKYINHPTKIHLSIEQNPQPSDYPSITFCNMNALEDEIFLDMRKSETSNRSSINEKEYQKFVFNYVNRILVTEVNSQSKAFIQQSFQLNDFLIRCFFNKRLCYQNLTQIFHPTYGICYTFDNMHHVQPEDTQDLPHYWSAEDFNGDNDYHLLLELFLHQPEYRSYSETRAAYRIFIHRKYEIPLLSQNSVLLRPNRYTKLSFSQRIMKFTQQCRTNLTEHMQEIFQDYPVRYTQALCYKLCEQRFIEQHCHCIEPTLAMFYKFFHLINTTSNFSNISLCSIDNACHSSQIYLDSRKLCGECLPECDIVQYSIQSSYANYPNINSYKNVFQRVQKHFRRNEKMNTYFNKFQQSLIRDNILVVEITASPYPTEILTESAVYTWIDLISSIGGQTGLWIGISLIGFVELLELLYLLLNRFSTYFLSTK
ncbi:hypothetical protein I4U23_003088 [Adineta vaga]|nr:hypothetical protein I4U23_003088 [Adineta vaga]